MNTHPLACVVFAMFVSASAVAHADGNAPPAKAASSVAEMLQKKQESRLRDQFVKEGRWDDVRTLEEAQARRERERQQKIVAQVNDDLARSARAETPATNALLDACDKETLRMRQMKSANVDKTAAESAAF